MSVDVRTGRNVNDYTFFNQYVCSLGIEPTTFCAATAMLHHWATGLMEIDLFYWATEIEVDEGPFQTITSFSQG